MKNIFKLFVLIVSLTSLSSCEDVVQIKLDEGSKLYVIDAFVNDLRTTQKIRVVSNDTYFSNREAPPVSNAQVQLKDLTDNKTYSFQYTNNGYYTYDIIPGDTICRLNHQYRLEVSLDGNTYTSLSTQKRTARIDTVIAEYNDGTNGGFGTPVPPFYLCTLLASDPNKGATDYYWIKTFRNDTLFASPQDINTSIDGTNGPVPDLGSDFTDFTPPITFIGFKRYKKDDFCKVEIHSISRETYFFFVQAVQQINNGGLFATTPENVKTNIVTPQGAKTNAVGWFNVASVSSMKVQVK